VTRPRHSAMDAIVSLMGPTLQSDAGTVSTAEALAEKKVIGLYFSAHWCPPCRGFTPQLATWYKDNLKAKGMEIIFVSSDRDADGFKSYFASSHGSRCPLRRATSRRS